MIPVFPSRSVFSGSVWLMAAWLCFVPGTAGAQSYLSRGAGQGPGVATVGEGAILGEGETQPQLPALFSEVERGNGSAVYARLMSRFEEEMRRAATDSERDVAGFHRTYLIHLLRAGEAAAPPGVQERTARAFVRHYPDDERFPIAFYHLNLARFRQKLPLENSFFFDDEALGSLPALMQSRYLTMQARDKERAGNFIQAAEFLLREMRSGTALGAVTADEVGEMLERVNSLEALSGFLDEHADVDWLRTRRPFLTVRVRLNGGDLSGALLGADDLLNRGLARNGADLKWVDDLKKAIRTRVQTRSNRIGVLLPLGSSSQLLRRLAQETLEGLRMAIQFPLSHPDPRSPLSRLLGQDLESPRESLRKKPGAPGPGFELVIRDSGNSAALAEKQVESLVRDDQVIAIIGPIARSESEAAARKAVEMRVPLITFSLSLDPPEKSHYVFRHSKSQDEEVRDLVRYSLDYLHSRRFAVLYPATGYGRNMMRQFWREVEQGGGKVVAAASFEPSPVVTRYSRERKEFQRIFENFTGQDRPIGEEEQKLLDRVGDSLPDPIVDFDALFIPVGPNGIRDLQQIAPYPVTVDAEHVQLLGSRFWNNDALLVSGGGKLKGAVFVDAFDRASINPKVAAFRGRHRTFFGHQPSYRPPTFYTGLGYDTVRMVMALLEKPENRSRRSLPVALKAMEPYFGVTGWTRVDDRGRAMKETMFFRVGS